MTRKTLALAVSLLLVPLTAGAGLPEAVPALPVIGVETSTGSIVPSFAGYQAPSPKTIDGDPSDWTGTPTRLGGTTIWSRGEMIYQDFVNDAWGADDGFDAQRLAALHAAKDAEPRTYRVDALQQAAGAQFDAPRPAGAGLSYGDTTAPDTLRTQADIAEARVAADASQVSIMVRTLGMSAPSRTAVLVLLDTEPGGSFTSPRAFGGLTTSAEWSLLFTKDGLRAGSFKGGAVLTTCEEPCPPAYVAAAQESGYTNTLEIGIRRDGLPATFGVGLATGLMDATGDALASLAAGDARSDLINVAFRTEPARIWMDERQALALRDGDVDAFITRFDTGRATSGYTESFAMRPGYYEAIYEEPSSPVNFEGTGNGMHQGIWQHYGVYLPRSYRGGTHAAMFWMHYRGGHAHDAAAWEPGILRDFGDDTDSIVITPSARGESSWYTGRGMVDFLHVWDDAFARWSIDADRVYLSGHSMGGWASNFLGLIFPDRWAASNPQDGLLCPCLWPGVGEPSSPQNGANVAAQFLYPLLGNARNLPFAILHGTADELVPVTGVVAHGARLHELGYRYRSYLFHAYEHYSAPIWDEWDEMARYLWSFRRDRDPARVTYSIKPALDHAVSTISVPSGVDLGFRFDKAYWVSGLRTRTPGIAPSNIGTVDATTWGRGVPVDLALPEGSAGLAGGPYTMNGQRWVRNGLEAPANRFAATLTNLSSIGLDVARMALSTSSRIDATISTDGPATVALRGSWAPAVTVSGASGWSLDGDVLTIELAAAGSYVLAVG